MLPNVSRYIHKQKFNFKVYEIELKMKPDIRQLVLSNGQELLCEVIQWPDHRC